MKTRHGPHFRQLPLGTWTSVRSGYIFAISGRGERGMARGEPTQLTDVGHVCFLKKSTCLMQQQNMDYLQLCTHVGLFLTSVPTLRECRSAKAPFWIRGIILARFLLPANFGTPKICVCTPSVCKWLVNLRQRCGSRHDIDTRYGAGVSRKFFGWLNASRPSKRRSSISKCEPCFHLKTFLALPCTCQCCLFPNELLARLVWPDMTSKACVFGPWRGIGRGNRCGDRTGWPDSQNYYRDRFRHWKARASLSLHSSPPATINRMVFQKRS